MYSLLYGFYKYLTQKDEFCVLILGLDNAGKTVSIRVLNTTIIILSYYCKQFLDIFGIFKNEIQKKLQGY